MKAFQEAEKLGITSASEWQKHLTNEKFYQVPKEQTYFINIVNNSKNAYNTAPNELAQGGTKPQRGKTLCRWFGRSLRVQGWVGHIRSLTTNGDGWGILSIRIADNISLETTNNAYSNAYFKTLIKPGTKLFKDLATLNRGDRVKFSGTFLRDKDPSKADCIDESSLTLKGSMTDPDFSFRFHKVHLGKF